VRRSYNKQADKKQKQTAVRQNNENMKIPKAQPHTPFYDMNYSQPKINYTQVIYITGRYKCGRK